MEQKKNFSKLIKCIIDMVDSKSVKRTQAEKILDDIEAHLRSLITEKKKIKQDFAVKLKELDKQRKENQN
jgi:hypothetical protein